MTPREYAAMRSDLIETARTLLTDYDDRDAAWNAAILWAELIAETTYVDPTSELIDDVYEDVVCGVLA